MSTQSEPVISLAGEYHVVTQRRGDGIDYYLRVVGPDGRETEQKVYWMYSMTPHQVAEAAVAKHVGEAALWPVVTRENPEGGYVVTVEQA